MGKKVVAVFLMCLFVLAAVHVNAGPDATEDYKSCFNTCEKACGDEGQGQTFCEMKCDSDCGKEGLRSTLDKIYKP